MLLSLLLLSLFLLLSDIDEALNLSVIVVPAIVAVAVIVAAVGIVLANVVDAVDIVVFVVSGVDAVVENQIIKGGILSEMKRCCYYCC